MIFKTNFCPDINEDRIYKHKLFNTENICFDVRFNVSIN